MKNNILVIELEKLVEDYYVLSSKLSEKSKVIDSFFDKGNDELTNDIKHLLFIVQIYDKEIDVVSSKIKLLSKILSIDKVELHEELQKSVNTIASSHSEILQITNGRIEIIDEYVNEMISMFEDGEKNK